MRQLGFQLGHEAARKTATMAVLPDLERSLDLLLHHAGSQRLHPAAHARAGGIDVLVIIPGALDQKDNGQEQQAEQQHRAVAGHHAAESSLR